MLTRDIGYFLSVRELVSAERAVAGKVIFSGGHKWWIMSSLLYLLIDNQ
jgi:hypothetical protein